MFRFTFGRVCLFAAVACVGMLPSPSRADGFQIYRETRIGKDGQSQLVLNDARFFDREVQNLWNLARPQIEQRVKADLGKPNGFGSGFTLYNITFDLARTGPVRIEPWGSGALMVTLTLSNNHLRVTTTVPGPTPKSWDPTIDVRFDATLRMVITMPRPGAKTRVTWVGANVTRAQASSRSAIVAVAKFFVDSFSNGGSRALLQSLMNIANAQMQSRADFPLTRIDAPIEALRKQGYTKHTSRLQNGQVIVTMIKEQAAGVAALQGVAKMQAARNLGMAQSQSSLANSRVDQVLLNPQPLPPRGGTTNANLIVGSRVNPALFNRVDSVLLNPQPLPPR
jgi:hypothetical protein